MSQNDKFYRTLAIIAVVAIVAIAVVVVGPKLLEGGAKVSEATEEVATDVQETAKETAKTADNVATEVKKAVSPKSWSSVSDGPEGVVEMFKSDPLYNGSKVEVVTSKDGSWPAEQFEGLPSLVVLKYEGYFFYFIDYSDAIPTDSGKYRLYSFSKELIHPGGGDKPVMFGLVDGTDYDSYPPPITWICNTWKVDAP